MPPAPRRAQRVRRATRQTGATASAAPPTIAPEPQALPYRRPAANQYQQPLAVGDAPHDAEALQFTQAQQDELFDIRCLFEEQQLAFAIEE
jgi:hypothetical protein